MFPIQTKRYQIVLEKIIQNQSLTAASFAPGLNFSDWTDLRDWHLLGLGGAAPYWDLQNIFHLLGMEAAARRRLELLLSLFSSFASCLLLLEDSSFPLLPRPCSTSSLGVFVSVLLCLDLDHDPDLDLDLDLNLVPSFSTFLLLLSSSVSSWG